MHSSWVRRSVKAAVLSLVVLATIGARDQAYAISSCTATCNSNCALTQNVSCNNQDGIVLSGGADLDLAGYSMTCTANCPQSAVKISAGNSIVKSTGGGGVISGPFTYGVNCQSNNASEVVGITVDAALTGIHQCAKVSNNLVLGSLANGSVGIAASNIANSDYIRDNWVEGFAHGITAARTHDIDIEHNTIGVNQITAGGGANEVGISASITSGSPSVNVANNSFFGNATLADFFIINYGPVYQGNFCDPANALCAACTLCRQPSAPIF